MDIKRVVEPSLQENTYVLISEDDCVIIDPGSDDDTILAQIHKLIAGKRLRGVLYTHCHFDHIRGGRYFNADQYMSEEDIDDLPLQSSRAKMMWGVDFKEPENIKPLTKQIILGGFNFTVFQTPGHTNGSVCFVLNKSQKLNLSNPVMFSGDTLFKGTYGRIDLGGNGAQMTASLKFLSTLPPETVFYPGHGESSTIGAELRWLKTIP
ncbi:MBL fold metallo-hydrolase [Candidatus Woesearchaeota archaeon]|nr:MBL fold metallo-hydrolase [Candidatus Woesearchaeota archaeon]